MKKLLRADICFLVLLICMVSSCIETKESTYFNNAPDKAYLPKQAPKDNLIQKNDILSISIHSLNADASAIFNTPNNFVISSSTSAGANSQSSGYLVNTDGYIQLPILGNIKAEGLTKTELKDVITKTIIDKKLLVDPIVNIRHLNYEVTVLGEVARPTVINVPNEKISMLKAIGLAGDITVYGKKDNVLLIRETNGEKDVVHVDLNSADFLTSPYYYLLPNDVVYVESNKNKLASVNRGHQLLPALIYGLSVIAVLIIK